MRVFKYKKILYGFLLVFLYESSSFSANETTKQLINKTLAKYGISSEGKRICGTDEEPYYDKNTGIVRCYDNNKYYKQNCWDSDTRSCKPCPLGFVVNKRNYIYCHKIICPEGFKLIKVQGNNCPNGFTARKITTNNPCPSYTSSYNELKATSNYSSSNYKCKNIKK